MWCARSKIQLPTLVLSGLKKSVITEKGSNNLVSAMKNVKRKVLLNCDHMLQCKKPHEVVNALLDFFQQCDQLSDC